MSKSADEHVANALASLRAGEVDVATSALSLAVTANPRHPDALHLLGVIAFQAGHTERAVKFLQSAVRAKPDFADAHSNLGSALIALSRIPEAEVVLRRAVALNPAQPIYRFNLGNVLAVQKKTAEAVTEYEHATTLKPDHAEAWNNLGISYRDLENLKAATPCFEQAVKHKPDYADAYYNLANAYRDLTRLSDAEIAIRKAIEIDPNYAKAYNTLGNILSESARSYDALMMFERAHQTDPSSLLTASNVLSCLQYVPGVADKTLAAAHARWMGNYAYICTPPRHKVTDRDPARRLTIGFVSPDLGNHPCGFLSVGLFERLDHTQLKPIVFSTRRIAREDDISKRIAAVAEWRRVGDLTDDELAQTIADANVDILIDMSGHTAGHRLVAFGQKAAPIQMTWLGYVGSTGLTTMDYIIADRWQAPDDKPITGPEKILTLDDGYTSFEPLAGISEIHTLPALKNGYVTFGNLNNPTKLNDDVVRSHAAIMQRVPGSRMLMAFRGLDDPGVTRRLHEWFAGHGVTADRIDIRGYAQHLAFLGDYHEIDIALDTFPYSGGLTTCEALWMGVPVVTYPGETFAGRHAASYMHNAGLGDFVAADRAGFETLAVSKANDLAALQSLRTGMRERLNATPVRDHARFAASFTRAMRRAWQQYISA